MIFRQVLPREHRRTVEPWQQESRFLAKSGSCQKERWPCWGISEPLKGEGNFSSSAQTGKRRQLLIECVFSRCQKVCMSWKTEFKWLFCMLSLVPLTPRVPDFVHLLICPCLLGLVLKKNSLKLSGKRLDYVPVTVDIWTRVRGQNWSLPVCHTSKREALVSACAAQQQQMPAGNLQMHVKTFRPRSVKCHCTGALKWSVQHEITQELPNVVAGISPNTNTLSSQFRTELQRIWWPVKLMAQYYWFQYFFKVSLVGCKCLQFYLTRL